MTLSIRLSAVIGLFTVLFLTVGIGFWGAWASIAGAIIGQGQVQIEARAQIIQHRDGGVVKDILVRDGDRVAAGDPLLVLDEGELSSQAKIIAGQLFELRARAARLVAERDGMAKIEYPADLKEMAELDLAAASIIKGQDNLFTARLTTFDEARRSLEQQKLQVKNEIVGQRAQIEALEEQLMLVETELFNSEALLEEGLVQSTRVTSLKRERASLAGQHGELEAEIARNLGRIAQIDIEILGLSTRQREEALSQLRDVEPRIAMLAEELGALQVKRGGLTLTAPTQGIVHDMRVHSLGAVIRPAEPVLFIIPQNEELTITAKIDLYHVDQVFAGSPVTLRFSAFNTRTTPEISAEVSRVSADVTTDERTGLQFYNAEVRVSREEIARLGGHALLPGMPVEVFIKTGERSPLSYFAKPFTDYFERAFRE